jgi:hypothetical protein
MTGHKVPDPNKITNPDTVLVMMQNGLVRPILAMAEYIPEASFQTRSLLRDLYSKLLETVFLIGVFDAEIAQKRECALMASKIDLGGDLGADHYRWLLFGRDARLVW